MSLRLCHQGDPLPISMVLEGTQTEKAPPTNLQHLGTCFPYIWIRQLPATLEPHKMFAIDVGLSNLRLNINNIRN